MIKLYSDIRFPPTISRAYLLVLLGSVFYLHLFFAHITPNAYGAHIKSPATTRQENYKAAKDYYYHLERDKDLGALRKNWLVGVRKFRKIYLEKPTGSLAPSCLFMMGRMQHKMYKQFSLPIDLDDALSYFNDTAKLFPNNSLADDALFRTAEIQLYDTKSKQQAAEQYFKIIKRYPNGDHYAKALNRLQKLKSSVTVALPETTGRKNGQDKRVNVLPVKYWSSADYTRVVIRASAPVHFSSDLLEPDSGQPRRLYIDFSQSYIPPKFRSPIPIEDGLLRQVRTGQFNDTTVRVVLDMESISTYRIFSLNDPFRVVVDVHGKKKGEQAQRRAREKQKEVQSVAIQQHSPQPPAIVKHAKKQKVARPSSAPFISLHDNKKKPANGSQSIKPTGKQYSLAQQLGLRVRKIVIDPGHGGKDPGATAYGLKEKDIVLSVSKKIANALQATYGYDVELTRTGDYFLPLEERTAIANTKNADLFLSIHVNAHPNKSVRGTETYYLNLATNAEAMRVAALENATSTHNISELQDILTSLMQNSKINESSRLAQTVHNKLVANLPGFPVKDLGVKQAPFYVLIGAEMPAVLAEIAFITNRNEARLLQDEQFQNRVAARIATGVAAYVSQHTAAGLQM